MIVGSLSSGLKTTHFELPSFIAKERSRRILLLTFLFLLALPPTILVPLSQHFYEENNGDLSQNLFTSGFAVFAINKCLLVVLVGYFYHHFRVATTMRMETIADSSLKEENKEFKLLVISMTKVNRSFRVMFFVTGVFSVFLFLMAFYDQFFVFLNLSKAFCGLYLLLNTVPSFAMAVNLLAV